MQTGISVIGLEDVKRMLSEAGLRDSTAKAIKVAINESAKLVRVKLKETVNQVFDRPTPYTQSSIRYTTISETKNRPSASVDVKSDGLGVPPVKPLWAQIQGGQRALKKSEVFFQSKGILPGGMITRPGPHATIDKYGNMSSSQIKSIMEVFRDANQFKKQTGKYQYFIKKNKGIFRKIKGARGAQEAMMFFVKSPTYKKRFDFYGVGQKEADRVLPIEAAKSLQYALEHY